MRTAPRPPRAGLGGRPRMRGGHPCVIGLSGHKGSAPALWQSGRSALITGLARRRPPSGVHIGVLRTGARQRNHVRGGGGFAHPTEQVHRAPALVAVQLRQDRVGPAPTSPCRVYPSPALRLVGWPTATPPTWAAPRTAGPSPGGVGARPTAAGSPCRETDRRRCPRLGAWRPGRAREGGRSKPAPGMGPLLAPGRGPAAPPWSPPSRLRRMRPPQARARRPTLPARCRRSSPRTRNGTPNTCGTWRNDPSPAWRGPASWRCRPGSLGTSPQQLLLEARPLRFHTERLATIEALSPPGARERPTQSNYPRRGWQEVLSKNGCKWGLRAFSRRLNVGALGASAREHSVKPCFCERLAMRHDKKSRDVLSPERQAKSKPQRFEMADGNLRCRL